MDLCESALLPMKDKQSCQKVHLSGAVRDEVERVYMDIASDHRRGRYPGLKRVTNSMVIETLIVAGLRANGRRAGEQGTAVSAALRKIAADLREVSDRLATVVE
ncbi:MAG TPA: hypothetical protein VM243_03175 [Phycisphaerae bacterium]|nr:hypothetical protein [Phycisphaerae bacterium]